MELPPFLACLFPIIYENGVILPNLAVLCPDRLARSADDRLNALCGGEHKARGRGVVLDAFEIFWEYQVQEYGTTYELAVNV